MRGGAAIVVLATLACARAQPVATRPAETRPIAVLPCTNLSGGSAPLRALQGKIEAELRGRGVALVPTSSVEEFLARHRIRYTGGVDAESARAAGEELGAGGLLVTTLETYDPSLPPREAIAMRLVAADDSAAIRWIGEAARAGDDSPGAFDLGLINDVAVLEHDLLTKLTSSLAAFLAGSEPPSKPCPQRFAPRELFRSPALDLTHSASVAVLPFLNETERRFAGELVALDFVRQFQLSGRFQVVEPGVLREDLLKFRIVTEGGLSLDQARVVLELVRADYVVAGTVREYEQPTGPGEAPRVQFTVLVLDRKNNEVVWESTSYSRGDDGVWFFGLGRVATAAGLSCSMVRSTVAAMAEKRPVAPRQLPRK